MGKGLEVFNPVVWISKFIYTEDFIIVPIWALIKLSHGLEPDVIMSLFPAGLTVGFFLYFIFTFFWLDDKLNRFLISYLLCESI